MTCTPVKNDFEMPAHSLGVIVGYTIAKSARQLTEQRVVKPETQIQADERWDPATAAVNTLDGAAIEDMLIDLEDSEVAKLDCRHLAEEGDSVDWMPIVNNCCMNWRQMKGSSFQSKSSSLMWNKHWLTLHLF